MPRAFLNHFESDCLCSLFYSYILREIWGYTEHLLEDGDSLETAAVITCAETSRKGNKM